MNELWILDLPDGTAAEWRRVLANRPAKVVVLTATEPVHDEAVLRLSAIVPEEFPDQHNRRVAVWVDQLADLLDGGVESAARYRGVRWWLGVRHSLFFLLQDYIAATAKAHRILEATRARKVRIFRRTQRTAFGECLLAAAEHVGIAVYEVLLPQRGLLDVGRLRESLDYRSMRLAGRVRMLPPFRLPPKANAGARVVAVENFVHANILKPLFHKLIASGAGDAHVLAFRPRVRDALASDDLSVWPGYRLMNREARKRIRAHSANVEGQIDLLLRGSSNGVCWAVEGIDLRARLATRLRESLMQVQRYAAGTIEQCCRVIEEAAPDVVISTTEVSLESRVAFLTAHSRSVPTVALQHGVMVEHPLDGRSVASRCAVWAQGDKDLLVREGNPAHKFVITGNPAFDGLFRSDGSLSANVQGLIPPPVAVGEPFLAVFTTQPSGSDYSHEERDRCLMSVVRTATMFPEATWILKLHPADTREPYERIVRDTRASNVRIVTDHDVHALMAAAHLVITMFSTTGLEAILLGRPLIVLNLSGLPDRVPYSQFGAAIPVRDSRHLPTAVRRALWDTDSTEALAAGRRLHREIFGGPCDGRAAARVAELVLELASSKDAAA